MGEEIRSDKFTQHDFEEFRRRLEVETALLKQKMQSGSLAQNGEVSGFELEAWLIDRNYLPSPINESFLKCVDSPKVVAELSRFNVEVNSAPHPLQGNILQALRKELEAIWGECQRCAQELSSDVVMIGILPTLRESMLTLEHMSPMKRYYALNDQIMRLRHGRPFHLDIQGSDHLVLSHQDVMLESAATSLQIHLQVELARASRFYNASQILSAPMVAAAANSPFLFQKDLWDETRIPLFEQAVDLQSETPGTEPLGRVGFGSGYARHSLLEFFEENLSEFPIILPILYENPPEQLSHLRLHNGTIWRWNRPIVGVELDGRTHLRIEHRVAPAGPSMVDVVANIAFFFGVVHELAMQETPPETCLPFHQAQDNFYAAAKEGLESKAQWLNGKRIAIDVLILEELIPIAARGLTRLGIAAEEADYYLREILANRIRTRQNGSSWQRKFIAKHGRDFPALLQSYAEHQREGQPVHQWSV